MTQVMLASAFQTKPNFNKEFRRMTGLTPSAHRLSANTVGREP